MYVGLQRFETLSAFACWVIVLNTKAIGYSVVTTASLCVQLVSIPSTCYVCAKEIHYKQLLMLSIVVLQLLRIKIHIIEMPYFNVAMHTIPCAQIDRDLKTKVCTYSYKIVLLHMQLHSCVLQLDHISQIIVEYNISLCIYFNGSITYVCIDVIVTPNVCVCVCVYVSVHMYGVCVCVCTIMWVLDIKHFDFNGK